MLEDSCENKIYDIIPVIFVEGLNSKRNLQKKNNIYYLSIEDQNRIFQEITFLLPNKRRENIGFIYAKKIF